jgi:hypothetical protein
VVGDYNQFLPRVWTPNAIHARLEAAFEGWVIATAGKIPGMGRAVLDHLAHTPDLAARRVEGWEGVDEGGKRLSDHAHVLVELTPHEVQPRRASP